MKNIVFSVDVERDLHDNGERGVKEGLIEFEKMCDRHNLKPVLFVAGSLVKKNKILFKRLEKKGWEISLHGFSHKRFDEMPYEEKEEEIKKSVKEWEKHLGFEPKGFRAPQHSIDNKTLDLLEKYGFEYDSSYTPLNLMEFLFFPLKPGLCLKLFFSRLNFYKIRDKLEERPCSALLIPFVSLTLRVFPKWLLSVYIKLLKLFYKKPVFYAHSWDFVSLPKSRIDRMFGHKRFIEHLEYVMGL